MESIFNKYYNYNDYKNYLKSSLLPDDFQIIEEDLTNSITINLKLIDKIMMIGYVPSLDLTVYEFKVKNTNDPRVSLSREAFRVLSLFSKLKALVLFIPDNLDNYRLSLITIDLKLKNNGIEKIASNPKRFSYLLGTNAKMHTVLENLYSKGRVSSFDDLLSRFSIESVNEEFYKEISHLFFMLSGGINKEKNKLVETKAMIKLPLDEKEGYSEIKNFCVRLIGRIIFCWFLKKKKSTSGIPLIPHNILSSELVKKGDYYHSVLEKLFFEVLNKQLAERSVRTDQRIEWDKIPFLNGGLFDPSIHMDFYTTGVANYGVKVPDEWFLKLFEILELYNFTIDENTPIDIELSIDPEMLGRIFENLLAEINPETQESARKATGSFYTPRPVVEYMVDESLKMFLKSKVNLSDEQLYSLFNYAEELIDISPEEKLEIIDAFDELRILDPACGSGAFPMGILQKVHLILQKVDPESEKWMEKQLDKIQNSQLKQITKEKMKNENIDFIHKLGIIQNCIFGVDLQPMAVEISKLRFFLTLIVDEKIKEDRENRGINPLPNLAFKFVTANTLIGLGDDKRIIKNYKSIKQEYENIIKEYFNASDQTTKMNTSSKLETIKTSLENQFYEFSGGQLTLNIEEKINKNYPAFYYKLLDWDPFKDSSYNWFDPKWMFGVFDGFDIVIGNPPYVQLQKFKGSSLQKLYKEQNFVTYDSMGDIYGLFYEKGISLLKDNGHLCLITSNKWMRAGYGEKLRRYFSELNPKVLIDLGSGVFNSATVSTNILLIENGLNKSNLKALTYYSDITSLNEAISNDAVTLKKVTHSTWFIGNPTEISLKEKIERIGKPLKDWEVNINYGIKTALNEAFIIDNPTKERLCTEDPKSSEIFKKILRGKDIKRYSYEWAGFWIIATGFDLDIPNLYPAVYNHLLKFEEKAKKRDDQGKNWWNLRACKYYNEFEKEKIIWTPVNSEYKFCLVPENIYFNNSIFMITSNYSRFFLALLNSKMIRRYLTYLYSSESEYTYGSKESMELIPICQIFPSNQPIITQIETLVNEIQALKTNNLNTNTTEIEKQIDQLVYQLYDLTEEEIALVEKG